MRRCTRITSGWRAITWRQPCRFLATVQSHAHATAMANPSATVWTPLACDATGIATAGRMIREGLCVAFPTETVYGLGANALNEAAVRSIFLFKGRPLTDPLIVHVPSAQDASKLLVLSQEARVLFDALTSEFWPGPLTLVARAHPSIPPCVSAETGFVGVRVPRHPIALQLLEACGVPVAAPSANRFGHVSPTRAAHVVADLGHTPVGVLLGEGPLGQEEGAVAALVGASGATCSVGIESTVVKLDEEEDSGPWASVSPSSSDPPAAAAAGGAADGGTRVQPYRVRLLILRRGGVSVSQLRGALDAWGFGSVSVLHGDALHEAGGSSGERKGAAPPAAHPADSPAAASLSTTDATSGDKTTVVVGAEAPGMMLTHYAPDLPCFLVVAAANGAGGEEGGLDVHHVAPLSQCIVLDLGGTLGALQSRCLAYADLSPAGDICAASARVFELLRWAERVQGAKGVLLCDPRQVARPAGDSAQHAEALRDRLYRAASGRLLPLVGAASAL